MTKTRVITLLFYLVWLISCQSTENSKNLTESITPVRSIDPLDEDYTDLIPLKTAIGDAKMVLLGEQEHGDGSTFLAKSRLVKFLHAEMGFNVVAFEADFFGVNRAWDDYQTGKREYHEVLGQLYLFWSQSQMCEELFRAIEQSQHSNTPIRLAGIDCRQVAGVSRDELIPSLDSLMDHYQVAIAPRERLFFTTVIAGGLEKQHDQVLSTEEQARFMSILDTLSQALADGEAPPFWLQALDNLSAFMTYNWHWWIDRENDMVNNNYRDIQMAENSLWLLNEKYKGEKVIVWAANSHIAKTDTLYEVEAGTWKPNIRQYPMGEVLLDSLGDELYTIGFTSSKGQSSTLTYDPEAKDFLFVAQPFASADSGSFEHEFRRAGFTYAFLDLKTGTAPWLRENKRIRIWRPEYVRGKLPDIYDGVFYIHEMRANVKR